jgi:hypothetical protein
MAYRLKVIAAALMAGAGLAAWVPAHLHRVEGESFRARPHYEFVVSPGEDPAKVHFDLQGMQDAKVDSSGRLELHLREPAEWRIVPRAYQIVGSVRHDVPVQFAINEHGDVLFIPGSYDKNLPLIIDPVME